MTANNGATGPASARSNTVTALTVPSMPTSSAAGGLPSNADVSVTAFWTVPSANGGSPITGYRVTTYLMNGSTVVSTQVLPTADASLRKLRMTGLQLRGQYAVSVQALNAAGSSPATAVSNTVAAY